MKVTYVFQCQRASSYQVARVIPAQLQEGMQDSIPSVARRSEYTLNQGVGK